MVVNINIQISEKITQKELESIGIQPLYIKTLYQKAFEEILSAAASAGCTYNINVQVMDNTAQEAKLDERLELRACPFCGHKPRLETLPENCTRLRCSNQTCYLWWNPWTSYHNGDTEEHAVQRLAAWWNGKMMGGGNDGDT